MSDHQVLPLKTFAAFTSGAAPGLNKIVSLPVEAVGFKLKLHQIPTGKSQTAPLITRNQRFH